MMAAGMLQALLSVLSYRPCCLGFWLLYLRAAVARKDAKSLTPSQAASQHNSTMAQHMQPLLFPQTARRWPAQHCVCAHNQPPCAPCHRPLCAALAHLLSTHEHTYGCSPPTQRLSITLLQLGRAHTLRQQRLHRSQGSPHAAAGASSCRQTRLCARNFEFRLVYLCYSCTSAKVSLRQEPSSLKSKPHMVCSFALTASCAGMGWHRVRVIANALQLHAWDHKPSYAAIIV